MLAIQQDIILPLDQRRPVAAMRLVPMLEISALSFVISQGSLCCWTRTQIRPQRFLRLLYFDVLPVGLLRRLIFVRLFPEVGKVLLNVVGGLLLVLQGLLTFSLHWRA